MGTWHHLQGNAFTSIFEFSRYNPDGSLFSTAKVTRTIELSEDGDQFTSSGTVEDFDPNGVRISLSCPTEMAMRVRVDQGMALKALAESCDGKSSAIQIPRYPLPCEHEPEHRSAKRATYMRPPLTPIQTAVRLKVRKRPGNQG